MVMRLEENLKKIGFSILQGHLASILEEKGIFVDGSNVGVYEQKRGLLLKPYKFVAVERSVRDEFFHVTYAEELPFIPSFIFAYLRINDMRIYYEGKFNGNTGEPEDGNAIEILKKLNLYS